MSVGRWTMLLRSLLFLMLTTIGLSTTGCRSTAELTWRDPLPTGRPWTVAVLPMVFRMESAPWRAADAGARLGDALSTATGLSVWTPGEFTVRDVESDNAWDVLDSRWRWGPNNPPTGAFVVRSVVDQRVSQGGSQAADARGQFRPRADVRIERVIRVEVLAFDPPGVVASATDTYQADALAEATSGQTYPDIDARLAGLLKAVVRKLGWDRGRTGVPDADEALTTLLGSSLSLPPRQGVSSARDQLAHMDEVEADVLLETWIEAMDPGASEPRRQAHRRPTPGLWVDQPSKAWSDAGIRPGDVLEKADGVPLYSRSTLRRVWKPASPVVLDVRRAGESIRVTVPAGKW